MRQYLAGRIRNIALTGHSGSGKTSLTEALLFKAGATDRLGKVADGNTVSDYDPEELRDRYLFPLRLLLLHGAAPRST